MSRLAGPATGADAVADADLAAALAAASRDEEFERAVREHHEVKEAEAAAASGAGSSGTCNAVVCRCTSSDSSGDANAAPSTLYALAKLQLIQQAADLNEEAARSTNTPPRGTTIAEQLDEYMAEPAPAAEGEDEEGEEGDCVVVKKTRSM